MTRPTGSTHHFTVFTMDPCPHCKSAKELLTREKQSFLERATFTREELIDLVG